MRTTKKSIISISTIALAFFYFQTALAHHGLSLYDTTQLIEIEGTVMGVDLQDPHSVKHVESKQADGSAKTWLIEGGSASGIIRSGLNKEFLLSKPKIKANGFALKNDECLPGCRIAGENFKFER